MGMAPHSSSMPKSTGDLLRACKGTRYLHSHRQTIMELPIKTKFDWGFHVSRAIVIVSCSPTLCLGRERVWHLSFVLSSTGSRVQITTGHNGQSSQC